jgi:hypothetical protein
VCKEKIRMVIGGRNEGIGKGIGGERYLSVKEIYR